MATAPWRLAKAVRRYGLGPITSFVILSLRRYGLKGAIRLAAADRRARTERAEANLAGESNLRRSAGPPDLDQRFALPAKVWSMWRPWVGAAQPHPDPYHETFEDAAVLFVVQTNPMADSDGLARTEAAIQRLPTAQLVVVQPDKAPDYPPGRPDRFVVVLQAGDIPAPDFARELARAARGGVAEAISFDLVRHDGDVVYPLLLPGANPILLAEVDYLFSRVALRGEALGDVSILGALGPRARLLQWLAGRPAAQVRGRWRHVGRPLLEVAVTEAEVATLREAALAAGRAPVSVPADASVSVVICTKDKGHLLRQLVRSLLAYRPGAIAEIVIVANNTTSPHALQTLSDLVHLEGTPPVIVARRDTPFNFSKLSNEGARIGVRGSHLLFLNDDIAPVSEDWLDRLLSRFNDPEVAAVAPLLLYPDERVQHGGMYLGLDDLAGHTLRGASLPDDDYLFTCVAPRETSCLTAAALLVQRSAFEAINGFDEQLATYLQDVDLGLRLHRIGLRNVFDPTSVLIHMESASIRSIEGRLAFHRQRAAELARFQARWGASVKADTFHPAGFDLQDESLHRLSGARGVRPLIKEGVPLPAPRS